jgi:cellulose biosynthesis protein BcsQ
VKRFLQLLKKEFSGNVLEEMIPASIKVVEAENSKQTIYEKSPEHPASLAYIKLAKKLSEVKHERRLS